MTAKLIMGTEIRENILNELAAEVQAIKAKHGVVPGLVTILIGENPASISYVTLKIKTAHRLGFKEIQDNQPANLTEKDLLALIDKYNKDDSIHGILVQLPLPKQINEKKVLNAIDPDKDVDGFHPYNIGRLTVRMPRLQPCTPRGVMTLLEHTGQPFKGQHAVVVGASNIVGRPMCLELLLAGCTVTVAHKFTTDLGAHVRAADILVVAAGKPGLIPGEWVRPGAVVVDVGINRLADGRIVGDVEFDAARTRASWITPVPGGVGPMTVATLLQNTLLATELQGL